MVSLSFGVAGGAISGPAQGLAGSPERSADPHPPGPMPVRSAALPLVGPPLPLLGRPAPASRQPVSPDQHGEQSIYLIHQIYLKKCHFLNLTLRKSVLRKAS